MTDAQWAERVTALANDRAKKQLADAVSEIQRMFRDRFGNAYYNMRNTYCGVLVAALMEAGITELEIPKVFTDYVGWLKDRLRSEHEDKITDEMTARLDLFGQLRKAKGDEWTPRAVPPADAVAGKDTLDDLPF